MALQPGLELAFGLHLVLQRAQRLEAGADVGQRAPSCAAAAACARRCSSSCGTFRCSSCSRASACWLRLVGAAAVAAQRFERGQVGRRPALAFAGQALARAVRAGATARRRCGSRPPAPGSAAAPAPPRRAAALLCLARRATRRRPAPAVRSACSSACAASSRPARRRRRSAPRVARSSACASACRAAHCAFCAFRSASRRLRALAALDDVADALFEPADLERRIGQLALALVQQVVGGVVRLAQPLELGLDLAQLGEARFQRVRRVQHAWCARCSSPAASRCFRNHSWCSFSVPCSCSGR